MRQRRGRARSGEHGTDFEKRTDKTDGHFDSGEKILKMRAPEKCSKPGLCLKRSNRRCQDDMVARSSVVPREMGTTEEHAASIGGGAP